MDVSAQATMKGAAKCDKHCELQNSVNQQILERILRCRDIPDSMPASASEHFTSFASACELFARQRFLWFRWRVEGKLLLQPR